MNRPYDIVDRIYLGEIGFLDVHDRVKLDHV